jgi:hypothetical protein
MSSTEITVRIDANAADYRRVLWWYQRTRTVITAVLTFLVLFGIGYYVSNRTNDPAYGGLRLEFIIALLCVPFIAFGTLFFGVWRQARKIEEISVPSSITFNSNGISSVSESSETDVQWKRFNKVVETEQDFIVFPQENVFYPVPKRFFEDASQIVSLRTLIMEHLGERSKLKT